MSKIAMKFADAIISESFIEAGIPEKIEAITFKGIASDLIKVEIQSYYTEYVHLTKADAKALGLHLIALSELN